jgi:hypothetical protein
VGFTGRGALAVLRHRFHMVATPDGKLYLACSDVNKVAIAEVRR